MQVPANTNDLNQLLPKHINLSDYNSLRAATFWLPIKRSKKDKSKWVTLSEVNHTQVTFLLWALGQPNGELTSQDCIMSMPQRGYFDSLCEDNNWFYCTLNMTILLRLRGLQQQQSVIDTDYFISVDSMDSEVFTFRGVTGLTNILHNFTEENWNIETNGKSSQILGVYKDANRFPIGKREWFLKNGETRALDLSAQLKLTKVFFCYDMQSSALSYY